MIFIKFYKNVLMTSYHLNRNVRIKCVKSVLNYLNYPKSKLLRILPPNFLQYRNYQAQFPALADSPQIIYPTFFKALYNQYQCKFLIRNYVDKDFDISEFLEGAKHAVSVVSNALAKEDYESIQDLVTSDVILNTKTKIDTFTVKQKELIAVDEDDIYVAFPHAIEILSNKKTEEEKTVEITAVFHSLRGYGKLEKPDSESSFVNIIAECRKQLFVCNYKFIRDYTDVNSCWTINTLNHFTLDQSSSAK